MHSSFEVCLVIYDYLWVKGLQRLRKKNLKFEASLESPIWILPFLFFCRWSKVFVHVKTNFSFFVCVSMPHWKQLKPRNDLLERSVVDLLETQISVNVKDFPTAVFRRCSLILFLRALHPAYLIKIIALPSPEYSWLPINHKLI